MIQKVIFMFLFYSVVGWLWETPFVSLKERKYINRGFLRGPYIPIYGYCCLSVILLLDYINLDNLNGFYTIIIQLLIVSFISIIWEYGTSWILESLFKQRWWDYSYKRFNLHGRVALDYTIMFGVGGFILWRFTNPILSQIYNALPNAFLTIGLIVVSLTYIADSVVTIMELARIKKFIIMLNDVKEDLYSKYQTVLSEILNDFKYNRQNMKSKIDKLRLMIGKENRKMKSHLLQRVSELELLANISDLSSRIYNKFPKLGKVRKTDEEDKQEEQNQQRNDL